MRNIFKSAWEYVLPLGNKEVTFARRSDAKIAVYFSVEGKVSGGKTIEESRATLERISPIISDMASKGQLVPEVRYYVGGNEVSIKLDTPEKQFSFGSMLAEACGCPL